MIQISFYFRTRDQYQAVDVLLKSLPPLRYRGGAFKGKLFSDWDYSVFHSVSGFWYKLPQRKEGTKKYIGVLTLDNVSSREELPFDIKEIFEDAGVTEIAISKPSRKSLSDGEELEITIQSIAQFNAYCRKLDSVIGHGQWSTRQSHVRRKIQMTELLLTQQPRRYGMKHQYSTFQNHTKDTILAQNGIKISFIIPKTISRDTVLKQFFISDLKNND